MFNENLHQSLDCQEVIYVSASFLLMMNPILDEYGADKVAFFAQEGVDFNRLEDIHYRVSKQTSQNLWQHLYELTLDPLIGIKAGRLANPRILSILGSSMHLTDTPLQGLKVLIRFFRIFCNAVSGQLVKVSGGYCVKIKIREGETLAPLDIDAFCSALVTICRQHYGEDFAPSLIILPSPVSGTYSYHERFYRCPIQTDPNKFELYFADTVLNQVLDNPIYRSSEVYSRTRYQALENELKLLEGLDLVEQVKILIKQNLTRDELIAYVAQSLNFTERTLQRRLASQNCQFRKLQEQCRHEVAMDYIKVNELSLVDLSHLLGFSNYNNFAKSFKRWTGLSPNQYRKQRQLPEPI